MSFESYAGGPGFLKVAKDEKEKSNTARNIALGLTGAAALGGAAAYTLSPQVKQFIDQKAQTAASQAKDLVGMGGYEQNPGATFGHRNPSYMGRNPGGQ